MTLASEPVLACGVDFGMTTSSLGVATSADGVRLIEDPSVPADVRHDIPTALCLSTEGEVYIGRLAVRAAGSWPDGYIDNFKRNVGERQPIYLLRRPFAVAEIVTLILRHLREEGGKLGATEAVRTVLTVPSVWTDPKKDVLLSAAEAAGFDLATVMLQEEPVAAYEYARTLGSVEDNRPLLVYDLGGGTFDCALLQASPSGAAQTLLRAGLPKLGGVDFDHAIKEDLADRYPQVRQFLNKGLTRKDELEVMASCEAIKKRLSLSEKITEQLEWLSPPLIVECDRKDFNRRIDPLVEATIKTCDRILYDGRLDWDDLQAIAPVGGSSAVPLVRQALNAKAVGKVLDVPEPELAVVRGATMLGQAATIRRRGKAPAANAKARTWDPVARPPEAPVEIDHFTPSATAPRWRLALLWILLIAWIGAQATLAFLRWQELGWWATAGCSVAAVATVAVCTARRRFPEGAVLLVGAAAGVAGTTAFAVAAVYFYRSWIEGHGGNGPLGLWSVASGLLAWATVGVWIDYRSRARRAASSSKRAKSLGDIADAIRAAQWFGNEASPPPLFEPLLLKIPAARAFELSPRAGLGFRYALAAGSLVVFVHESLSEDDRPQLDAALDSWRDAFRTSRSNVQLRTVILMPGQRVPDITADEALRLAATLATDRTFVDTVGPLLLDAENKVYVSVAERLLEKATTTPAQGILPQA
jgi:actin-like ATPase involved in cell morphogenesis